ncbi:MAG: alkyl sulfatase [Actinomycetia bacterium]|nr:alkyl sulfatase [Actinomycetes bacterium]MCP4961923.1 alkyl sulfatase [Actinomycetes bacterium]
MTVNEETTGDAQDRDGDLLAGSNELVEVAPGIFGQQQAGWLLTIPTDDGLVQIDTGDDASASIASIRRRFDQPFCVIAFSHGHPRYNFSARRWVLHNVEQFGRSPRVVGHENVVRRQQRYVDSAGLQNRIIERQFRYPKGSLDGRQLEFMSPTETFSSSLRINSGEQTIDLLWAPSETDDAIAAWFPDQRVMYGGAACIPFFPNVGSPQRSCRDALRWANTLDRLATYPAETLILEFGPPIEGTSAIQEYLQSTGAALRWCHETVIGLMNQGYNSHEIINMVEFPGEIFDRPWLAEGYTSRQHVLRDVYRGQFGWWEDQNPTSLNPAHPAEVAAEVRAAIGDPGAVLAHARSLAGRGQVQLALHVVDLVALGAGFDEVTIEARALKVELCRAAADSTTSYVTQSLYLNGADELERTNSATTEPDADDG